MQEGTPASPVRVLIADELSGIVSTLDKLAPFGDEVEPCGMARDPATLVEETGRLRPDVILLNPSLTGEDPSSAGRTLLQASPQSRILLLAADGYSRPPGGGDASGPLVIDPDMSGRELVGVIHRLRPQQAPSPVLAEPIPPLAPHRRRRAPSGLGEIYLVFAGKGGVGKSMVATNLAVALRQGTRSAVALVDLDLQFGDVALMLGVEHHPESIDVLTHDGELVDQQLLSRVMVSGPEGVRALLAPDAPERAELITAPALRAILQEMRRSFDHIVIDGSAHLDEQTLEVMDTADHILVVTSFSLTAVKDTRIMVKLLRSLGVDRERVSVVLNQTRARSTLLVEDVEERLNLRVRTQLPFEHRIVDDAVDRGLPFVVSEPEAEISRRMHRLAAFLSGTHEGAITDVPATAGALPSRSHPFRRRFGIGRREEQSHEAVAP